MLRLKEMLAGVHPRVITRAHVLQCLLAGAYIFVVFLALDFFKSNLAVASLGGSAFNAFCFPHTDSSKPRFVLGGYVLGAVCGLVCWYLDAAFGDALPLPGHTLFCALSLVLAMFSMAVLNYEHPPAAALAIAITVDASPAMLSLAALMCALVLCIAKEALKPRLHNL